VALGPDGKVQILFVCTGNICRSPMAEALLKQRLNPKFRKRVRIVSAGTHALEGLPTTMKAQSAAAQFNVDLSSHRSQPLTPWLISHSDLILAMEPEHVEMIRQLDPTSGPRTFLIAEFGLPSDSLEGFYEIMDPISGDESVYRRVYQELAEETDRILPSIEKVIESAE